MQIVKEGLNKAYKEAGQNAYFGNGFESGVKFAQRWIPVEEELPEQSTQIFKNDKYNWTDTLICKTEFGNYVLAKRQIELSISLWCWRAISGKYNGRITHWRPIEYPLL